MSDVLDAVSNYGEVEEWGGRYDMLSILNYCLASVMIWYCAFQLEGAVRRFQCMTTWIMR